VRFSTDRRHSVRELTIVREWGVVFSLTDGCLLGHSISGLVEVARVDRTQGATTYCVDVASSRVCVGVKKKLLLFRWSAPGAGHSGGLDFIKEMTLPEQARVLLWANHQICIGFAREYDLIDVASGFISKEIFETGRGSSAGRGPAATVLESGVRRHSGGGGEMLLANDVRGIFVGFDGRPARSAGQSILWPSAPLDLVHTHPYVVSLLPATVDVHNTVTTTLTQRVSIAGCKFVSTNAQSVAASASAPAAAATATALVVVATPTALFQLTSLPIMAQIGALVSGKDPQFQEALQLCALCAEQGDASPAMRQNFTKIRAEYALDLFGKSRFEASMAQFQTASSSLDVRVVLALYPALYAPDRATLLALDGGGALGLERRKLQALEWSSQTARQATAKLIPFLVRRRVNNMTETRSGGGAAGGGGGSGSSGDDVSSHRRGTTQLAPLAELELIDTVLVKAYVAVSPHEIVAFFSAAEGNFCDVAECEDVLQRADRFRELVALYRSKGLHRRALELLQEKGRVASVAAGGSAAEFIRWSVEYLQYMQHDAEGAPNQRLVLEFSGWVLDADPRLGLEIFVGQGKDGEGSAGAKEGGGGSGGGGSGGSRGGSGGSIEIALVLAKLRNAGKGHEEWRRELLAIDYLEHLMFDADPPLVEPALHNECIYLYVDAITTLQDRCKSTQRQLEERSGQSASMRSDVQAALDELRSDLHQYRNRLLRFLRESRWYEAEKILSKFPKGGLLEERATLLMRVGKHESALHIYVHQLRSRETAERYCAMVYSERDDFGFKSPDVYLELLRAYLRPPPDSPRDA
jgi:uncharacterized membrane protein YgcG